MNALESDLRRLPEPALPEGLTAAITGRIARVAEERVGIARRAGTGEPPGAAALTAVPNRFAWAAALVGMTVGVGTQLYRLVVGETAFDVVSPRIVGIHGPAEMLSASPAAAVLAAGLLLYLASFFAPLLGARQRK